MAQLQRNKIFTTESDACSHQQIFMLLNQIYQGVLVYWKVFTQCNHKWCLSILITHAKQT